MAIPGLPGALGIPKADWAGLLVRAVVALERIADSFEETEPIDESRTVLQVLSESNAELFRRQMVGVAKTIQLHATSLTAILDDDQDQFQKAKRLRQFAKTVHAYGKKIESEHGEEEAQAGQRETVRSSS